MKMTSKIKAFTLSEMLVVLLLTLIIVGLAFSVLRLVQEQMKGIEGVYMRNTEFNLFRQSLWNDFNQNDGIWYHPGKEELVFANGLREITYRLDENHIIKARDTFNLKIASQKFFFKGKERTGGKIDALDMALSKQDGSQQLFVFKKNSATCYLNE